MAVYFAPDIKLETGKPIRIAIHTPLATLAVFDPKNDFPKQIYHSLLWPNRGRGIPPTPPPGTLLRQSNMPRSLQPPCWIRNPAEDVNNVVWDGYSTKIVFDVGVPPEDMNPEATLLWALTDPEGKIQISQSRASRTRRNAGPNPETMPSTIREDAATSRPDVYFPPFRV
ncbi:hypothetical protein VTK56DRAFT_1210 [Thermocarpiscus australiensis]